MRAYLATLILVLAMTAPTALADDRASAERHFRTGERLFTAGDFVHAAASFEQAYASLPLPAIAFSGAQAYRLAWAKAKDKDPGHLRRAVELYRIYVEQEPKGDRVVEASAALGDLEPLVARLGGGGGAPLIPRVTGVTVTSALAGVKVEIDGGPALALPLVKELPVGEHQVVATAPGYAPRTLPVSTVDGALVPVEIELDPLPSTLAIRAEGGSQVEIDGRPVRLGRGGVVEVPAGRHLVEISRRGRRPFAVEVEVARGERRAIAARQPVTGQRRIATWVLYGAGGLALGAGVATTLTVLADGDASDLADLKASRGLTLDEAARYDELRGDRDDLRSLAIGLGVTAAAVAATGVLLYVFDHERSTSSAALAPSVAPTVSADGAGVSWTGRF